MPEVAPVIAMAFPVEVHGGGPYASSVSTRETTKEPAYDADAPGRGTLDRMDTTRRGNYDSGEDFVLEYGELRFTFNERDFSERCEQAARKLGFVREPPRRAGARGPREPRRQRRDLRARPPASASTSTTAGPSSSAPPTARSCTGCAASSSAPPGSTSASRRASSNVAFDEGDRSSSPTSSRTATTRPIQLAPEPSWSRVAYVPALSRTARDSRERRRSSGMLLRRRSALLAALAASLLVPSTAHAAARAAQLDELRSGVRSCRPSPGRCARCASRLDALGARGFTLPRARHGRRARRRRGAAPLRRASAPSATRTATRRSARPAAQLDARWPTAASRSESLWSGGFDGRGVDVAVIDSGVDGTAPRPGRARRAQREDRRRPDG